MCVGMLMSAPTMSAAQTREAERQYNVEGTVEAVDHANRTVTIRLKDGKVVTLDVPAEAVRFDQVKVGTPVQASYYDWVSIQLKPAGEPAVDRTDPPNYGSDNRVSAGCHEIQAARDHRHHHRLGSRQQDCELHRTKRGDVLARAAGHDRPQDRRRSQKGRSRRRHPARSGDAQRFPADSGGQRAIRVLAEPPHTVGSVRGGQPVQRQDDPGGDWPDNRGSANQPGRDHVRRSVWPRRDVQGRHRLSDDSTDRGRLQLRVVQQ